jgi:hypothetical protein
MQRLFNEVLFRQVSRYLDLWKIQVNQLFYCNVMPSCFLLADPQSHGTSKLTSYFAVMSYCLISRTEKLMVNIFAYLFSCILVMAIAHLAFWPGELKKKMF